MSKKPTIPKIIKVGPFSYKIILDDDIVLNDNHVYGFVDLEKCEIYLDRNLNEGCKKSTLIHEIMHAILNCNSFDEDDEKIHKVIDVLSIGLLDVLTRNKNLLNYLIHEGD